MFAALQRRVRETVLPPAERAAGVESPAATARADGDWVSQPREQCPRHGEVGLVFWARADMGGNI